MCGSDLTLKLLKNREFSLEDYRTGSQRFKPQERFGMPLMAYKWREEMKEASRFWEQFLDDRQQRKGDLSPIATRNLILPVTGMGLEIDFLPEPTDKNSAFLTPWFQPFDALSREPCNGCPMMGFWLTKLWIYKLVF